MKKLLAIMVVCSVASMASAQTLFSEDGAGLDRNNLGGWSSNFAATGHRDNILANGDNWLATNTMSFVKAPYGESDGTTAAVGFVELYVGASGDYNIAEHAVDMTAWVDNGNPFALNYTAAGLVNRSTGRARRLKMEILGVAGSATYSDYFQNVDANLPNYMGTTTSGFAGLYATEEVASGPLALSMVAGTYTLRMRMPENDTGGTGGLSGGNAKNLGLGATNIQFGQLLDGDADADFDVDLDDATPLIGNFGTTTGMTWADGDNDLDGDVDIDDATGLIGNWGSIYDAAAGEAVMTYDEANNKLLIDANAVALIKVENADGLISGYTAAVPFSTVQQPTAANDFTAGEFMTGNFISGVAEVALGEISGPTTFVLTYNTLGGTAATQEITVPEPATMSLLAIGGLVAIRRRRR